MRESDLPRRWSVPEQGITPLTRRLRVRLDGIELTRVVTFDCDAGTVTRFVTDGSEKLIRDGAGRAKRETLTGIVTVEIKGDD